MIESDGEILYKEVLRLSDDIELIKKRKRKILSNFARDKRVLNEGDRIELIWPNGKAETIDICTPAACEIKYDKNEFDVTYGYRNPNKDGSKAKIGIIRKLWQSQLFVNGYKKLTP